METLRKENKMNKLIFVLAMLGLIMIMLGAIL